jgi:hypothetical protein
MTKTVGRYKNQFMGEELYEECGFWTLEELAQVGLLNRKEDESSMLVRSVEGGVFLMPCVSHLAPYPSSYSSSSLCANLYFPSLRSKL